MKNISNKDVLSNLILHPDFEKLKADIEKLRTELSMLVLERDNLIFQECKNIEMAYMLNLGWLEYKAYEIECAILRLKRKVELIQARKNREENVVISAIEEILDYEFAEFQNKLNQQLENINAALKRSHQQPLTDEESREMKKLYRSIIKSLHPDLHPHISEEKIQLFFNAVKAYQHGDLNELRIIAEMITTPLPFDKQSDGLVPLVKEKERLMHLLQTIKDNMAEIKSEYPYNMKSLVQNPIKTEARKAEHEGNIKQLEETLDAYKTKIEDMLRGKNG